MQKDDEHRLMIDVSRGLLGIYGNIQNGRMGSNVIVADFPLRWTVQGMGELLNMVSILLLPRREQFRQCTWIQKLKIEVECFI